MYTKCKDTCSWPLSRWFTHTPSSPLLLPTHLRPRDDDPDKADVVGADAVQTLVDALREKLAAIVAHFDWEEKTLHFLTKDEYNLNKERHGADLWVHI